MEFFPQQKAAGEFDGETNSYVEGLWKWRFGQLSKATIFFFRSHKKKRVGEDEWRLHGEKIDRFFKGNFSAVFYGMIYI